MTFQATGSPSFSCRTPHHENGNAHSSLRLLIEMKRNSESFGEFHLSEGRRFRGAIRSARGVPPRTGRGLCSTYRAKKKRDGAGVTPPSD
ncbi:hypothetical protein EVAR_51797_1 [Eumeta japonica]|uniref:Uncharacterized protein n=1 Tax=Eumeta variegata TaxID=151549 RepID=A0A4C2A708_EUMVA|nr:hypothetical protein EVAR_51797_1 [Eumeta japonica]